MSDGDSREIKHNPPEELELSVKKCPKQREKCRFMKLAGIFGFFAYGCKLCGGKVGVISKSRQRDAKVHWHLIKQKEEED